MSTRELNSLTNLQNFDAIRFEDHPNLSLQDVNNEQGKLGSLKIATFTNLSNIELTTIIRIIETAASSLENLVFDGNPELSQETFEKLKNAKNLKLLAFADGSKIAMQNLGYALKLPQHFKLIYEKKDLKNYFQSINASSVKLKSDITDDMLLEITPICEKFGKLDNIDFRGCTNLSTQAIDTFLKNVNTTFFQVNPQQPSSVKRSSQKESEYVFHKSETGFEISPDFYEVVEMLFRQSSNTPSIDLSQYTLLNDDALKGLAPQLSGFQDLQSITFANNPHITTKGVCEMMLRLKLGTLTVLNCPKVDVNELRREFSSCQIHETEPVSEFSSQKYPFEYSEDYRDACNYVSGLTECTTSLDLSQFKTLNDHAIQGLLQYPLDGNTTIENINLSGCNITNVAVLQLVAQLNLKSINLTDCPGIKLDSLSPLVTCEVICNSPVAMSNNCDEAIKYLANLDPSTTVIDLSNYNIKNRLQDVTSLLKNFKSLNTLSLGGDLSTDQVSELYFTLGVDNLKLDVKNCTAINITALIDMLGVLVITN